MARSSASAWRASAALVALALASCTPPCVEVSTDCEPLYEPTFDNVWALTLEPSCALSGCHVPASAPAGLVLAAGLAYDNLVNVESSQIAGLDRVEPGDPDQSYLLWKLEGNPDRLGQQMPFGASPLDEELLQLVRDWIAAGAMEN